MIKTTQEVSFDTIDFNKKAIVFAKIRQAIRTDENETYTLIIEDWVELPYTAEVPNEQGQLEEQTFYQKKIIRTAERVMTFTEADQLTDALDQMYNITETGSARRKRYTILGHLLINNSENVRNAEWVLV